MRHTFLSPLAWGEASASVLILVFALAFSTGPSTAQAQTPPDFVAPLRTPPIPARAELGTLVIVQPPEALLNDQPERLAPGARIRGRNNLLVLPATLVGQTLPVRYVREPHGLLHELWILTDAELAASSAP